MLNTTEMEQAKTWLDALRSGKYKQGKNYLQSSMGYCCLGVGCKVLIEVDKLILDDNGFIEGTFPIAQNAPSWLGKINHKVNDRSGVSLVALNDEYDFTFPQIANVIESYLREDDEALLQALVEGLSKE